MKFNEVIGQEEIKQRLMKMVENDKVPHAILLCGATGYGTLALAVSFAAYLLGERETGTPTGVQAMLDKFQHPDLHFVFPVIRPTGTSSDKKITTDDFIQQWVQQLQESMYFSFEQWLSSMDAGNQQAQIFAAEGDELAHKLSLKSSQGGYKVCVIWLPERMHPVFANKILKLLEEPPQKTIFIMASEEPQSLLETIRSRVQRINVKRLPEQTLQEALISRCGLEEETAHRVARIAHGNWLDAIESLNVGAETKQFHDMFKMLMRMAYQRNTKGMKKWSETVATFGREKQKRMLGYFSSQIRENFMYNFQNPDLLYMTQEEELFSRNFARFINEANVVEIQELIDRTTRAIGQNANAKMQFFDFALSMIIFILRK